MQEQLISAVVLDLNMPHINGDELLLSLKQDHPECPVIIITGIDQVDIAVQCMKNGAFDYQTKVAAENRLVGAVKRAIEFGQLKRENSSLKNHFLNDRLDNPEAFAKIITSDKSMRSIFQYMEAISTTNEPILITGETGTGKELVARALHQLSSRRGEFVAVNIAGLDDTVFADTLFGHQKGAFTGANDPRKGLIAKAANGTLFLDEIGDLGLSSQTKLLRLLQEREYLPLGADISQQTNTRMIFATHHNLDTLRSSDSFRPDLFYRLRAHHIHVPALRDRRGDIPLLLNHFLKVAALEQKKPLPSYPPELTARLAAYQFPGNIRELRSMIFDALSKHTSKTLSMKNFKIFMADNSSVRNTPSFLSTDANPFRSLSCLPTIKEASNFLVKEAMSRAEGNQSLASEMLGITRQALGARLKKQTTFVKSEYDASK